MKGFKKLILTSAILAASSSAFAMQAMSDESMSATTGQDGLTVKLDVDLSNLTVKYVDRDGIAGGSYTHAGGVVISPIGVHAPNQVITIDAGGNAGTGAGTEGQLKIGITMGTLGNMNEDTIINLNNTTIGVGDAVDTAAMTGANNADVGGPTNFITFGNNAELRIAAGGTATVLLGNRQATYTAALAGTPDGDPLTDVDGDGNPMNDAADGYVAPTPDSLAGDHLISLNSNIPSITLTGMSILDTVGGGQIGVGTLRINGLNAQVGVDVVDGGLRIDTNGTTIGDVGLERVVLGNPANSSIGDLYISGLTANNVITVTGH